MNRRRTDGDKPNLGVPLPQCDGEFGPFGHGIFPRRKIQSLSLAR